MKCQVAWNWRASRTELVVTSQKHESLVLTEAEWLANEPSPRMFPVFFEYSHAEAKRVVVRYDIMRTTKLSKLLKRRVLSTDQALRLLAGLDEVIRACTSASMLTEKVLYHPDFVYLDEQMNPNFIFVPFGGMVYDARLNSPFAMLAAMSDPKRMHWQSAEGEWRRDAVQRFVHSEKVFSVNQFNKLLGEILQGASGLDCTESPGDALRHEMIAGHRTEDPEQHTAMFMGELFKNDEAITHAVQTFSVRRDDTGEVFVLPQTGNSLTMGSSLRCDIAIKGNAYMQGVHVRIRPEDDCVCIEDCDSTHGTFAFNRRLAPHTPVRLYENDKFLIGGEPFYICAQASATEQR